MDILKFIWQLYAPTFYVVQQCFRSILNIVVFNLLFDRECCLELRFFVMFWKGHKPVAQLSEIIKFLLAICRNIFSFICKVELRDRVFLQNLAEVLVILN